MHLQRQRSPSPLLTLVLGLVLSLGLWTLVEYERTRSEAQRTAESADRITEELDRNLRLVEQSLRMAAAGVLWRTGLDDNRWAEFADRLQLPGLTLGGVTGLGFAPASETDGTARPGTDSTDHVRYTLRFARQWDGDAPLPVPGTDLTANSPRIPDIWRARRNLGPVYSLGWSAAIAGGAPVPTVWLLLAVENDGDVRGGTRGILVASLRLDTMLRGAVSAAPGMVAELAVPGEAGALVRVEAGASASDAGAMRQTRDLSRPGPSWILSVGPRRPVPMFGGSGLLLAAGVVASLALFAIVMRNRDARRRADRFEARAARSESRFERLCESAPFLVWMADNEFGATYLNPVWRQLTGSERTAGLGAKWRDAIHPADRAAVQDALSGSAGEGTFRCRILHRDGNHRWLLVNFLRLDDDGTPSGFMGVGIDIDSVQRADELREADRQLLRELLDSVPAPICAKDENLRYTLVNDALCRLLGRTREEILGQDDFYLYAPEDADTIRARDRHAFATGTTFTFESHYRLPDGRSIDATGAKTVIRRADGTALVLTNITDVTALRTQERALVAVGVRLQLTGDVLRAALDARPAEVAIDMVLRGLVRLLGDVRVTFWEPAGTDLARATHSMGTASLPALEPVVGDPGALERYRDLLEDLPCVVIRDIAAADEPAGMHGATAGALIGMPVRVRGALRGILEIEADAPRQWTPTDVSTIADVGSALAAHGEFALAREERDIAYRDLGNQRAFLDAVLESIPHPVFVKDRTHRLVTVNQAFSDAWKLPKSEIVGRRDADLIPHEAAMLAYAEDDRVFEAGAALTREIRFRTPDGQGDWALLTKQPVREVTGREFLVGVAIPVGELKAAQQRAEDSERLLSAVLNAIPAPVVAKDEALRWVLVNDAYLTAIGRTRESALGRTDADQLPPEEAARFAEQDRRVLESGAPHRTEETYTKAGGVQGWRIKTKQVVRMIDGHRLVVTTGIDITDRKRVEIEAREAGRRLEVMNELAAATIAGAAFAEIAALAVQGVVRLVPCRGAVYASIGDGETAALQVAGFVGGMHPSAEAFDFTVAAEHGERLSAGHAVVIDDIDGEAAAAPLASVRRQGGMQASVEVPVMRRGRLRGVIAVCADVPRQWSLQEIGILQAVADALALALESAEARAERIEAERRLREAKDFVEGLIDAVPQAIFVKDEAGRWVMANQAFLRMSGHARETLIGRTNREVHPDVWERMDREDAEAFASPHPLQFEIPLQDPSGNIAWWLTSKSAVQLSAGTRYLVCSSADVSALKTASVEVERGRQFLDAVLNALPVPVFVKSADHRWVVVNEAGERLYGRPRSELVGRTDHDLHDKAFSDAAWREDDFVLAGRGPIVDELFMPIKDGTPRWILKTKVATSLADGSRFVIAASLDITGRKQAEEEVFASRARLEVLNGIAGCMVSGAALEETVAFAVRSLSEALGGAHVSYWRRDGRRIVVEGSSHPEVVGAVLDLDGSPGYVALLEAGKTVVVADALEETSLGDVAASSLALGMRAFVDVPISAGASSGLQALLTLSSSTPRSWSAHERRTVQEAAESLVLAHIGDSAERARAKVEAELRENEAVLQAMVWASDLGLWTWEVAPDRYRFSDRAKSQLGYAPDEIEDSGAWREHLREDDRPRFEAALRSALLSLGNRFEIECRLRHRDGTYRDILARAQIQRDATGRAVRFVGANIDVTEFRRTQADLIRHRDDLERVVAERTAELVTAKESAEAANEAKSEFLANMSHELRTPMHAILSFSRLGVDRTADSDVQLPKIRQYLDRIHQSGGRLLTLLNDLLDLSKLEAGKMRYDFARCDLVDVVDGIVVEMAAYARESGVRIDVRHEGPVFAWCDAVRVGQVVRNLLSNAVKFTPAGKVVRVVLENDDAETARVAVFDEGVGVPEDELEAVFDKFVQSSKTNSGAGGTGLGLAICREIARQHGGHIWARNNPAGGACFTLTLPATSPDCTSRVAAA